MSVQLLSARQLQHRKFLQASVFSVFFRHAIMSSLSLSLSLYCHTSYHPISPFPYISTGIMSLRVESAEPGNGLDVLSLSLPWFMIPFIVQVHSFPPCVLPGLSGVCWGVCGKLPRLSCHLSGGTMVWRLSACLCALCRDITRVHITWCGSPENHPHAVGWVTTWMMGMVMCHYLSSTGFFCHTL